MPGVRNEVPLPIRALELSEIDRANIKHLIGHTLARLERELILQTLQNHKGTERLQRLSSEYLFDAYAIKFVSTKDVARACRRPGPSGPLSNNKGGRSRLAQNLAGL